MTKCPYCGTIDSIVCCSEQEELFKEFLIELIKHEIPNNRIFIINEIVITIIKEIENNPKNLQALISEYKYLKDNGYLKWLIPRKNTEK